MLCMLQHFAQHPCPVKQCTNASVAVLHKSIRKAVSEKRTALMEWPLLGLDTCYLVSFLYTQLNPPGGFFAWWKAIKKLLDCKLCLRFKACRLLDSLHLRAHRGEKYFLVQVKFSSCLLGMNSGLRNTLLVWKQRKGFLIGRRGQFHSASDKIM